MLSYLQVGIAHILDVNGYDHMLFIAVLLAGLPSRQWKPIVSLITAFTLGHSLTLAITIAEGNILPASWVEFLIPVTILLTATDNLLRSQKKVGLKAGITIVFGLIHGMGFAGYLGALLPKDMPVWKPLLFFNVGVEIGQLIIAGILLLTLFLLQYITQNTVQKAQRGISLVGIVISLFLAASNWPL